MNKIDDYANSMFLFEELNPEWIARCARYLSHIFGNSIQGATVVDYAFGRGNWSLAFIEAGAEKVIAVDASVTNVKKFAKFIRANNISGIEIINGNILFDAIEAQADILWVYGILHHIDDPQLFMSELVKMWRPGDNVQGLLYGYNDNSLRQVIVTLARRGLTFLSYEDFKLDSFLFSHHARLRVRDDLTAPHVSWYSRSSMEQLLMEIGAFPSGYVDSFSKFEGNENAEFQPHHLLFGRRGLHKTIEANRELGIDELIILGIGEHVLDSVNPSVRKSISIGIAATHFDALAHGGYHKALIEDFLYLFYVAKVIGISPDNSLMKSIFDLARLSVKASSGRSISEDLKYSFIADFLLNNKIRI